MSRFITQETTDGSGASGAFFAQNKNVVARAVNVNPEFNGACAAWLTDDLRSDRKIGSRVEIKRLRIANAAELIEGERG